MNIHVIVSLYHFFVKIIVHENFRCNNFRHFLPFFPIKGFIKEEHARLSYELIFIRKSNLQRTFGYYLRVKNLRNTFWKIFKKRFWVPPLVCFDVNHSPPVSRIRAREADDLFSCKHLSCQLVSVNIIFRVVLIHG